MDFILIIAVGLAAGAVSGIIGTGSSLMLMPVLVGVFGPLEAVPIMAVGALLANVSRVAAWWREIDWRACGAYALTAVPAAALGARTLLALPPAVIDVTIGSFLIAAIPLRRYMAARNLRLGLWHLAGIGAVMGYATGIVVSTGPVTAPGPGPRPPASTRPHRWSPWMFISAGRHCSVRSGCSWPPGCAPISRHR